MNKRVIVAIDQEITDIDFERMGLFPQEGLTAAIRDFLLTGRGFSGLQVVAKGQTAVTIAEGRYYAAGALHASEQTLDMSLAEYIPIVQGQRIIITLVVQGREDPDYNESRNYEREVPTSSGGTSVQRVPGFGARILLRKAVIAPIPGAASLSPVRPGTPINTVAVADILVGTGGVELITRRTENEVPELDAIARAFAEQQEQIGIINQIVGGLRNDIAVLGELLQRTISRERFAIITADLARLKERFNIPDTGTPYGVDHFLDDDETNTGHIDYYARVEEGIRFPYANFKRDPVRVLPAQANDPNLMHVGQNLICPKYTPVDGISVTRMAATMPLGGTTYQTLQLTQLTMSRQVTRTGDWFEVCENGGWWQSGQYDPIQGIFRIGNETYRIEPAEDPVRFAQYGTGHIVRRAQKFWLDTVQEPYNVYAPVTNTIQGVIKAQTFIQSQDRWVPSSWLGIESWSTGAEITATFVELSDDGKPNPARAFASVKVAAAQFKRWPERTYFPLAKPVFLKKGRYGILYATTGEVRVATAEGQDFLGGTLFDSTDGAFFQGDLTKDLCFGVQFCRFDVTSMPVLLFGLNLDGGIHNLAITAAVVVPGNASAKWELNVAGNWREIADPAGQEVIFGAGISPYYDFRVTLNGNAWAMPVIDTSASQTTVFRADTALRHLSRPAVFGVNVTSVTVRATIGAWDPARHSIAARLRTGAGYATIKAHDAVTTRPVLDRPTAVDKEWTFNFAAPGIPGAVIEFVGATNNARITYHVEERIHDGA